MTFFDSSFGRPFRAALLLLVCAAAAPARAQPTLVRRAAVMPAPYSNTAAAGSLLTIPFNRPLNPATAGGVRLHISNAGPWCPAVTGITDSTISVLPTQPIRAGATVTVTMPPTVQNSTGAAIRPYCFQFTTGVSGGSSGFAARPLTIPGAQSVVLAEPCDLNNDGLLDLAVVTDDSLGVWLARSGGGYARARGGSFRLGFNSARAVRAADLNNDGNSDLIVRIPGSRLACFYGSGTGALTWPGATLVGYGALAPSDQLLEVADLNFDGNIDLLAGNSNSHQVSVYRGNAAGGPFPAATVLSVGYGGYAFLHQGILGDFNEDGRLDVVTADASSTQGYDVATISLSDPYGNFSPAFGNLYPSASSPAIPGWGPSGLAVADLNHDGHLDLVTTSLSTTLAVLLGDGTGLVAHRPGSPYSLGPNRSSAVAVGDLNADSHPDIVLCTNLPTGGSTAQLMILLGEGDGEFVPAPGGPLPLPALTGRISLTDLDGDGDLDIVAPVGNSDTVAIFHNQSAALPRLLGVSPASAAPGQWVTLSGTSLSGTTAIRFNNVPARSFSTNALGTSLRVAVPAGATSGLITVATHTGRDTLRSSFTVLATPSGTQAGVKASLLLYPNPARHSVRLQRGTAAPAATAQLLDATGRVVRTLLLPAGPATTELPLSGLPAGLYLVRVDGATRRLRVE